MATSGSHAGVGKRRWSALSYEPQYPLQSGNLDVGGYPGNQPQRTPMSMRTHTHSCLVYKFYVYIHWYVVKLFKHVPLSVCLYILYMIPELGVSTWPGSRRSGGGVVYYPFLA